jgi:hypothetical protein
MLEISRVAEQLLASQERLSSRELVHYEVHRFGVLFRSSAANDYNKKPTVFEACVRGHIMSVVHHFRDLRVNLCQPSSAADSDRYQWNGFVLSSPSTHTHTLPLTDCGKMRQVVERLPVSFCPPEEQISTLLKIRCFILPIS